MRLLLFQPQSLSDVRKQREKYYSSCQPATLQPSYVQRARGPRGGRENNPWRSGTLEIWVIKKIPVLFLLC